MKCFPSAVQCKCSTRPAGVAELSASAQHLPQVINTQISHAERLAPLRCRDGCRGNARLHEAVGIFSASAHPGIEEQQGRAEEAVFFCFACLTQEQFRQVRRAAILNPSCGYKLPTCKFQLPKKRPSTPCPQHATTWLSLAPLMRYPSAPHHL